MANSSESQQTGQSNQFSPSLFDFEAFLTQEAEAELLRPPPHDVGLDYQDYSDLDLAPRISYPVVEEDRAEHVGPNEWDDAFREETSLGPPLLEPPIHMNHGSTSVAITVTSPVRQTYWDPTVLEPLPPNIWSYSAPITRPSSAAAVSRSAFHTPGGSFLNPILNSFTSPSTPLHIIDTYKFPFEDELQRALEAELERQNEIAAKQDLADSYQAELKRRRESNDALEARLLSLAQDLPVPLTPAPTPAGDGSKTPRNKRPTNISNTDPKKWYHPLAIRPDSWGNLNPNTQERTFNYTEHGELNPRDVFSVEQMSEYIGSHRATLWIQTVPADSGRRYPSKTSDKCRFDCCPDSKRTIRKGDFRVAFDEHPSNTFKDPFHNAAYTHLFCLEKFLDFPQICKNFDVRPDTRTLKEGKNKMAITRDHKSMADIVTTFIKESVPWRFFNDGHRPKDYYEFTLCSKLTKEHLDKQPKHLQTIREQRGGNTIDIHLNNLDVYVANHELKRTQTEKMKEDLKKEKRGKKRKKKDMIREESDESGLDDEILQRGFPPSPRARKRPGTPETGSHVLFSRSSLSRNSRFGGNEAEDEEEEEESRQLSKRLRSGRRMPLF